MMINEPVAIVGTACRFPGEASSPSKLWQLLKQPRDVLGQLTADRLNLRRFYEANGEHHGSTDVKDGASYLLSEDYRLFDAAFFNINPAEADGMDPQQRITLETVYEALESAANRVSYVFDLHGPSVTIDTACSSSLVALHQAVQGLRSGDATTAVVAGANLILDPGMYIAESSLHMLSPDSRSRMWDKSANGYARGEGFAALVLKPLSVAIKDGDHIQAVVRGTGVNSDGRTRGITMPSAQAQTALIQQTYRNAGLDPLSARDRCQYFECHGTGTLAGDPIEAEAIRDAFFPLATSTANTAGTGSGRLFVGSIKTVVGHLEGCAGLAGVLKAVLAIQNRSIPPNLLFDELNPKIAPFYEHLDVPTALVPWPETGSSSPLRASVNSFGFGGTNAHIILESYECGPKAGVPAPISAPDDLFVGPLVFSAHTDSSLLGTIKAFSEHIKSHPNINLEDIAWVLQAKRTSFSVNKFFSGATRQRLLGFMDSFVSDCESSPGSAVGTRAQLIDPTEKPGILGVFTGQGAQWASMGRGLIESSHAFRESIERCEQHLAELPVAEDAPRWSLMEELVADAASSHISEALLSQPLCTALQIALVDLMRHCGIQLDAVVGHSSGEIAAVYYAGIIDSKAAMEIAYYRGYHARLAKGREGQNGRMMAVGLSYDDAEALCDRPEFVGRVSVAASNSPMSTTLSGDMAAIEAAKEHLDSEKTFARVLKTDTAYHSHHMLPCAEPYLESLRKCNIEIHQPRPDCVWISSVRGDADLLDGDLSELKGQYWVDNMCKPVLFSHAVEASIWNGGPFDVALEFGPHPALKGPVEQTFKASFGHAPAYAGLVRRGDPEVEAFSGAMGYVWSHLGSGSVDLDGYRRAFQHLRSREPQMLPDLPSYCWDHGRVHWRESRISRNYRLRNDQGHELLGRRVPDDSDDNMRWRNVLRLDEIPWVRGHVFQGQVLFPGAGYVAMALEAARAMAANVHGRTVQLFELHDVTLSRAIVIPEGSPGVETAFTAKRVDGQDHLTAEFACYFCSDEATGDLVKACEGRFVTHFGPPSSDVLPPRLQQASGLVSVDMDRFYAAMHNVGLDYTGLFNTMVGGDRSLGISSVRASWPASETSKHYLIHPAVLDVAFQSIYVAFSSPGSGGIWAPYLPVRIRRLAVRPDLGKDLVLGEMEAQAFLAVGTSTLLEGDIHLSAPGSSFTGLQVEGISMQAVSEPGPDNDKLIFSETAWRLDISSSLTALQQQQDTKSEQVTDNIPLTEALDRTALFYWKTLVQQVSSVEVKDFAWYHQRMFDAVHAMLDLVRSSRHPIAHADWFSDDEATITSVNQPYGDRVDLQLIHAVGQSLASVVRGQTQQLEVMVQNDMLNRFYMEGLGFSVVNDAIASTLQQITFKHPGISILEIGAGTGGTTRSILDAIGTSFASYTYTDISPGFFKNADEKFKDHRSKIDFRLLDVEKDVVQQGFKEHSFDVVIAANVLHATRDLKQTMGNARSLLKPGGYLVMMEITGLEVLRVQFIMGGLPGWWYGVDDGRVLSPAISLLEWDDLLQDTGFSGVDHSLCDMADAKRHSFSLIVSQAVDEKVDMLRNPLSSIGSLVSLRDILIIGGSTLPVTRLIRDIKKHLSLSRRRVTVASSLEEVAVADLAPLTSVICLQELDKPIFSEAVTEARLSSLQEIVASARHLLWVNHGGNDDASPYSHMSIGVGRALLNEVPDLVSQFVDMDAVRSPAVSSIVIVEMFLRLIIASELENDCLWTLEPEVKFDGEHRYIPRIVLNEGMNNTYIAGRRKIQKEVSLDDSCVELATVEGSSRPVKRVVDYPKQEAPLGHIRVRVQLTYQLETAGHKTDPLFLAVGRVIGTERWIQIHPMATKRAIQARLPARFVFVDISGAVPSHIESSLPAGCEVRHIAASDFNFDMLQAVSLALMGSDHTSDLDLDLKVVSDTDSHLTDWSKNNSIQVDVQPLSTAGLLSECKTYLLAGMTGELGLSLSGWLTRNGARHIALVSRNAIVDQRWLDDMSRQGIHIRVLRADMTDRHSVRSVVDEIRSTMPPVGGVCNGCMVLSDRLFMDLDPKSLATVLGPKVEATLNLDEAFQDTDSPLDFFILLSSLASIIGNAGQSNYHAANLFMSGLASQRRLVRGQAASVMHIGLVSDLGYVTRQARTVEERLRKLFMPLTEADVHHAFAEAIVAGKPDSGRQHELILGLQPFVDSGEATERPPWEHNPRFAHFVSKAPAKEKRSMEAGTDLDVTNIKQALRERDAQSLSGSEGLAILELVRKAFSRKLENMMQMRPDSVNVNIPLIDLGCDSLLAIEIRGWFLKEVGLDVPVLKVLSGDTAAQLCDEATKKFLASRLQLQDAGSLTQLTSSEPSLIVYGTSSSSSSSSGDEESSLSVDGSLETPVTGLEAKVDPFFSELPLGTDGIDKEPHPIDEVLESPGHVPESHVKRTAQASYSQSRLWFLTKYLDDPTTYNVTVSYTTTGHLSIPRIKRALAATVARHESLQTCFFEQSVTGVSMLMQQVLAMPSYGFTHLDSSDDYQATVQAEYERFKKHVWDLEHGPVFGVSIVSGLHHSTVIFGYHHIIMDGVSWHIFLRDLDTAYQMRPLGGNSGSGPAGYIEFTQRQIHDAELGRFDSELRFWNDQHTPLPSVMPLLPIAQTTGRKNVRESLQTYESFVSCRELSEELVSSIKLTSRRLRATPFHIHLAVIQMVFSRLLNLEDICIGVADANRTDEQYADTVGFFLNLLPVRFSVQQEDSLQTLVQNTCRKMFAAISNSKVPFDLILDALRVPRFTDHSPLFQVAVNYRMGALLQRPLGEAMLELASADDAKNPYDISFGITETAKGTCMLELTTQAKLYTKEASDQLLDVYVGLVRTVSGMDESTPVKDIPITDTHMAQQAIALGKGPRLQYPDWPSTLPERFARIAQSHPDDTAILCGGESLTYSELAARVHNIARFLRRNVCGSRVAALCEPSCDAVASMLAIMTAGHTYIPLDTRMPHGRHLSMIQTCKPAMVLCHRRTRSASFELKHEYASMEVVDVDTIEEEEAAHCKDSIPCFASPGAPGVILFTSGTTGVPKAIVLSHANLVNHLSLKTAQLAIDKEVVLQQSSLGFDMSIIQTFCALANGGSLVVAEKDNRGDPVELASLIFRTRVTFTIATPSEYLMMLRYGFDSLKLAHAWRQACMGGESVTDNLIRAFQSLQRPDMRLTNCYGPTEITAAATFETLPLDGVYEPNVVGRALPNYSIYILDECNQALLPVGVAGEVCIGGAGVAEGYLDLGLGLSEQTRTGKFLHDPYASTEDLEKGWSKMYRTGDRGRLMADGRLVFLGRIDGDSQVKLRGLRIELDDVAGTIIKSGPGMIADAVVTVRGQDQDTDTDARFLVAHVVLGEGLTADSSFMQQLLSDLPLPQYMIPSMIVPLDRLPMNSNGKVDRKALAAMPLPLEKNTTTDTIPLPTKRLTLAEGELRLLWEKVLPDSPSASPLEAESDFFMRGGNSMLLMRLQGVIKETMEVSIPIRDLYHASTLGKMADYVSSTRTKQRTTHSAESIDWAAETALSQSFLSAKLPKRHRPRQTQGNNLQLEILLTGSWGFLGNVIVASLAGDPRVRKVHCVAVPVDKKSSHAVGDKIIVYTGSLTAPNLGLSREECSRLQSSVDLIIHAGAHGHCLNNYSSLRTPNVHSTRFLASLALPRAVPMHYISSNRVTLLPPPSASAPGAAFPPSSVSAYFPPADGSEGFTASKWASERFLENLALRHASLDVCIHRPCAVTGGEAPSEDALNALLKYSRIARAVPRFDNFEGYLDFRDVRDVAAAIVSSALGRLLEDEPEADGAAPPRFVHYSSGQKIPFTHFARHMASRHGTEFDELSVAEWVDRALENGIDPLITGYLEAMTERKEIIRFPYMGEAGVDA
ncbi:hypothetical protein INS49_014800 [Diaporthe citri]|uniref:uncharacterized protein n=1 Tax=Diaporthe citri TaxID=83186 RepID=UPI001C82110F|nr:uncharacterized protein INS49_014800 [Diaporthe citri]KAG6356925.1 hypothetical protein INS49_014800 [Diaporthe citri]